MSHDNEKYDPKEWGIEETGSYCRIVPTDFNPGTLVDASCLSMIKGMVIGFSQEFYGAIEVDGSEKDIVQIWMHGNGECQLVQIEREFLPTLIKILTSQL